MTTTTEMMFSDGSKVLEFKLSGFSEETSSKLIQELLKSVTHSEPEPKKEKRITISSEQMKKLNKPKKRLCEELDIVEKKNQNEPVCPMEQGKVYELTLEPKKQQIQVENNIEETNEEFSPEVVKSLFEDDNATFQAYYICKCGDRGKHFIKRSRIHVNCKKCGKRMRVRDASLHGFPYKDDYGNTYIAGEFRRSDEFKYGAVFS